MAWVMPDEQILISSSGEVLYSPSKSDIATIAVLPAIRSRFFLFSSSDSSSKTPEMASDWRQICTKSTFGDAAVVQPAFRKTAASEGDPLATLICEPCFQIVSPMEWNSSKMLTSRFISDVAVVAGDVDVAAPSGFTKLPADLNYSASGDYVYLCVKRGGPRAVTQLHILIDQFGDDSSKVGSPTSGSNPEKVIETNCKSGGAAADGSGTSIRIGYDSMQLKGNMVDDLNTLAISDIAVVVGDQPAPSPEYIKIAQDLNGGASGTQQIYLYYKLAFVGGFVCDSGREHSEFGECLFASRFLEGMHSALDFDEKRLTTGQTALAAERKRGDAAVMETHYRQHQPGMLQRLQSGLQRVQSYESKQMQEEALRRIPVEKLHERARDNPSPMPLYQDELLKQLLHWFKREFFSWMNQPRCSVCNHEKTRSVRTEAASTPEELAGKASRVEVYLCPSCGSFTRFPRYNDPVKLLDTRTGRCGEWANCFTLCCRAMGFEARYVLDVTDHVWTEVYSEHFKRWLHCDSCEDQLDSPLTYEVGWGKKLSYIFSFAHDEVVDTARRYTQNWDDMRSRRQDVSEVWLQTTINEINHELMGRQTPGRVAILTARAKVEREELLRGRSVQKSEVKGRVSGSAEWRSQRNEDGKEKEMTASSASSTVTNSLPTSKTTPAAADILQHICASLVAGCQSSDCSNPYCFTGRTGLKFTEESSDMNERAAQAIQVVAALSSNDFPSQTLTLLECSKRPTELRNCLWKYQPLLYLPLQDLPSKGDNGALIDISGHNHHLNNSQHCALRKPFQIPDPGRNVDEADDDAAFGVQLTGGKFLSIPGQSILKTSRFVLSFLVRIDEDKVFTTHNSGAACALSVHFGAPSSADLVKFCVYWDNSKRLFSCELETQNNTPIASALFLKFGQYAHVAIARNENVVSAHINGAEIAVVDGECQLPDQDIVIEGPSNGFAAVISHVAVIPTKTPDFVNVFCAEMTKKFVSAPPLKAFGPNGEQQGSRCPDAAAGAQSGYRVARVLMWGGQFLDGIQFVYGKASAPDDSDRNVFGKLMGNANAKQKPTQPTVSLELLSDEVISRVTGRKGAWTDGITLHTNFGRKATCGGNGGGDFTVSTPAGSEIRSVTFKVGDHLTDICAFVAESLSIKAVEDKTMQELRKVLPVEPSSRQKAVSAALRYVENIARQPEEMKFQRIRASNKFFASTVGALGAEAAKSFMVWCGFKDISEEGEQFFTFQPTQLPSNLSSQRLTAEAHKRIHFLRNVGSL
ncbi:Peptide-N(4)-(N-acetyl-beta-glucosaminyl)asparagine amidase [Phytophthora citrophthora]|uniref:Peptide-N(4)-(N-acetyl-beta-glucosaminyl)asparagine amidase n=1 Tax=Phytophthora citrophthora TaxID=4793 RepID=A0AAD9GXT8_9STRA|nr:Peptide-N(4)-(N-acetyl-beta-glucosaminyl)asparagine amidase [Phytophthora citrophthora]